MNVADVLWNLQRTKYWARPGTGGRIALDPQPLWVVNSAQKRPVLSSGWIKLITNPDLGDFSGGWWPTCAWVIAYRIPGSRRWTGDLSRPAFRGGAYPVTAPPGTTSALDGALWEAGIEANFLNQTQLPAGCRLVQDDDESLVIPEWKTMLIMLGPHERLIGGGD
jgi:hypothetical protein